MALNSDIALMSERKWLLSNTFNILFPKTKRLFEKVKLLHKCQILKRAFLQKERSEKF